MKSANSVVEQYLSRGLSKKFCSVPFTTLLLEPDGLIGACRQKGSEFPVGHLPDQNILEVWNGEKLQSWRKEFLSGQPVICQKDIRYNQCNACPEYNSHFDQIDFSVIQSKKPSRLALNLNGKCNLECTMCHIWQKPNGLYDKMGFWDQLDDLTSDLREVELLSGEPFIQKDTYKLIDIISEKKPDCLWVITTNANWKLNDYIKEKLDKIKFRNLIVSLDSLVPETYSKIRKKGDLGLALQTLDALVEYEKSRIERNLGALNIRINFLVQKDNWNELGSFYDFKIRKNIEIFRTFLYEPFDLSILSFEESKREEILSHYLNTLSRKQVSLNVILPILDSVKPIFRAQFFEYLNRKDML